MTAWRSCALAVVLLVSPRVCADVYMQFPPGSNNRLDEGGGKPGDACTDRSECSEVCCSCEENDILYAARGCDLDAEECLTEEAVCEQALLDSPSLCDEEDTGADEG